MRKIVTIFSFFIISQVAFSAEDDCVTQLVQTKYKVVYIAYKDRGLVTWSDDGEVGGICTVDGNDIQKALKVAQKRSIPYKVYDESFSDEAEFKCYSSGDQKHKNYVKTLFGKKLSAQNEAEAFTDKNSKTINVSHPVFREPAKTIDSRK